jgi:TRAP-type mannitol/chloroaromatic compound transport system substrate-binding protein
MLQSFHQCGEQFEILFNKKQVRRTAGELKAIIDYAVQAASADMSWKAIDRNSKDYIEMQEAGRQVLQDAGRHPARAARLLGQGHRRQEGAENPLFKKVLDIQKRLCAARLGWQNDYTVDFKMAYNHYFAAKKAPAKKA